MSAFAWWCRDCEEYADTFKARLSGEHFCRKCETPCGFIPDLRPLEAALAERDKRVAELEEELAELKRPATTEEVARWILEAPEMATVICRGPEPLNAAMVLPQRPQDGDKEER